VDVLSQCVEHDLMVKMESRWGAWLSYDE
jgi:hypothetical protein